MDENAFRIERLEARVNELETEVGRLRQSDRFLTAPSPPIRPGTMPPPPAPLGTQLVPPPPTALASSLRQAPSSKQAPSFDMSSEAALKWGGIGLVVLAVGFAVSTAVQRGWIGPELQLLGAVLFAGTLIGYGLHLQPTRPRWTQPLAIGGLTALSITFSSSLFVDLAGSDTALICTLLVFFGGVGLSWYLRSAAMAATNLVVTALASIAVGADSFAAQVAIGATITFATVLLAAAHSLHQSELDNPDDAWPLVRVGAALSAAAWLLLMAIDIETGADQVVLAAPVSMLTLGILVLPSLTVAARPFGELPVGRQIEMQLVALAGPWLTWSLGSLLDVTRDEAGVLALAIAAALVVAGAALNSLLHPVHRMSLWIAASLALSIGIAALLSTEYILFGFAVQAAGLALLRRQADGLGSADLRIRLNSLALAVIAALGVAGITAIGWTDDLHLAEDAINFATVLTTTVAIALLGSAFPRRFELQDLATRAAAAVGLGLLMTWLGSVLVHLPQGQALVSMSWAAIGVLIFLFATIRRHQPSAVVGLCVLGLTVAKLITVDLEAVDTLWRAGLFLIVGLGLMRLGIAVPKLAEQPATEPSSESSPRTGQS